MPSTPLASSPAGRWEIGWLTAFAAAFALLACSQKDPQAHLRERATQYLSLKQRRDWAAIYQGFLDPEARKGLELEAFLKPRKETMDLLEFELVSAEVSENTGAVQAKMDVVIPVLSPRGGTTMMRKELQDSQRWVRRDGEWYIQLKG